MRNQLAAQEGVRKKFRATFERWGKKNNFKGYREETLLFRDVIDTQSDEKVTDHVWFTYSKAFEKLDL